MATKYKLAKPKLAWDLVPVGELLKMIIEKEQEGVRLRYKGQEWLLKLRKKTT